MSKLINGDYSFAYPNFLGNQKITSDMVMDAGTTKTLEQTLTSLESNSSSLTGDIVIGSTFSNIINVNSGSTIYNNNEIIKLKDNSTGALKFQCNDAGPTDLMIINTTNGAESMYLPLKYTEIGNVASGVVQIGDGSNVGATNLFGVVGVKNNITIGTTNANTITVNSGATIYNNNEVITLKDNSITGLQIGSAGNTNMMVFDTSDTTSNVNLNSGTNLILNDVTDASSSTDINSALVVSGGIACAKRFVCGNIVCNGNTYTGATETTTNLVVAGTTASSNYLTGAIVCSGGMGVAGQINSNSSINTPNSMSCGGFTNNGLTVLSNTSASSLSCAGGVSVAGILSNTNITDSSSSAGAIITSGGICCTKKLYVGNNLNCAGNITATGNMYGTNIYGTNGIFNNGITIGTVGGTLLNYYEEYQLTNLWAPSGGGAWMNSTNLMSIVRIGKIVHLKILYFVGDSLGGYISNSSPIASRLCPVATTSFLIPVQQNGFVQTNSGHLIVYASGYTRILLSPAGSGNFSSGIGSGLVNDVNVSWNIM